ncbi:MAG: PAS domain S-box protein [Candidatus Lokiarchaeota archaeon]|nr:PAS domain S-box protein [Candidatus Lokiarchaeota archaeon]
MVLSENMYQYILENSKDATVILRFDGSFLYFSPQLAKILGVKEYEIKNLFDLIYEEDKEHVVNLYYESLKQKKLFLDKDLEFRVRNSSGDLIWLSTVANLYYDEEGKQVGYIATLRDVSEKRLLEEKLKASEFSYRRLFENIKLGIYQSSIDGTVFLNVNNKLSEMLGYTKEELKNLSPVDLWTDSKKREQMIDELYKRGFITDYEIQLKTKAGKIRDCLVTGTIISDDKLIEGTIIDNTDRKASEKKLLESEEKFRTITEESLIGIFIFQDGIIKYANEGISKINEYPVNELIGIPITEFFKTIHIDEQEEALKIAEKKELGDQETPDYMSFRVFTKSGKMKWIEVYARTISYLNKNAILIVATDVTKRKKAEKQLLESEEKFRNLFENMSSGVAIIDVSNDGKDFIFKDINRSGEIIEGVRKEDVINKSIKEIFKGAKEIDLLNIYKKVWKTGNPHYLPPTPYSNDKKNQWRESYIYKLSTGEIVSVYDDVTERMESEEKVRESEEMFRVLTEQSLMAITIIQDQLIKYSNDAASELVKVPIQKLLNIKYMEFLNFIHPNDREFVVKQLQKKLKGDKDAIIRYSVRIIDGEGIIKWGDLFSKSIIFRGKPADFITIIDITKKVKAEQDLIESEEKFRSFTEQSLIGISIIQDGIIKYVNQSIAEFVEYSVEEITGWDLNKFLNVIHPSDKDKIREQVLKIKQGEYNVLIHYTFQIINKSGKIIWLENFSKPINYEGGQAILSTVIDITEKKEAEQKLHESEEKFRLLAEHSMLGIVMIQENHLIYANKTFSWMFEIPIGDLLTNPVNEFFQMIHPDDRKWSIDILRRRMDGEKNVDTNYFIRIITRSGKLKTLEVYANSITLGGKITSLVTYIDQTEKITSERKIRESEEKFRTISDQALMGIGIIQDGVLKYANETLSKLIGYSVNEILNWGNEEFTKVIHPEDLEFILDQMRKKQKAEAGDITQHRTRIVTKTGEVKWVENFIKLIKYEGQTANLITMVDMTERELAKEEIRVSEEKYKGIFNESVVAIYVFDAEKKFINSNQAGLDLLGCSRDELLGINLPDLDADPLVLNPIDNLLLSGERIENYVHQLKRKDGRIITVLNNSRPLTDFRGKIIGMQSTLIDISERIDAEEKLQESEEKYRTLTEQALMGIIIIQDNLITYINEAAALILEIDSIRYTNRNVLDLFNLVDVDMRDEIDGNFRARLSGELTHQTNKEIKIKTFSNHKKWLDIYVKDLKVKEKTLILLTFIEITGKKQTEEYLRESEEKFRVLAEQSLVGILILQDGRFKYINDAMVQILGIPVGQFLNLTAPEIMEQVNPIRDQPNKPFIALMAQEIEKRLAEGRIEEIKGYTIRIKHPSGKLMWLEFYANFIKYQSKDALLISCLDVSEKRKVELEKERLIRQITKQNKELLELDKLKDDFFADVSHEFRTPLVAIKGFTELLLAKSKNFETDQIDDLKTILKNETRLESLVNELLEYSRLKAGRIQFSKDRFTASELVNTIKQELDSLITQKQLNIESHFKPDRELILDKKQIQKVINNLLINAIKFSNFGGKILIESLIENNLWSFSIKDQGIGIKKDDLSKIFRRYGKLKTTEKMNVDGLGIGLAICKNIIDTYGGVIWAESEGLNKGATFNFTLELT